MYIYICIYIYKYTIYILYIHTYKYISLNIYNHIIIYIIYITMYIYVYIHISLHGKPYFLFPNVLKRWSFQKNCAGIWSFLYYQQRWYFFFPKIWSYTLDGKWKMIFLKKDTEIWYFLQTFWKDSLSKKGCAGTWSFLCYLERWCFFLKTWSFFSGQEVKDGISQEIHGNMMDRPAKKNRKPEI